MMADIDIQKKEGPPILPIILGVLALVAVIAAFLLFRNGDDRADTMAGTMPYDTAGEQVGMAPAAGEMPMSVQTYRQQCGDTGQFPDEMGREHEYAADCMRQLADAIDDVVRRETVADQPLQQRLEGLKQRADAIREDPTATDHANRVRGAAMESSEIIEYIAQQRSAVGANLQQHAQQTRQAAEQIETATPLLEQRERTATFFSRAGDALEAMAQSRQAQPRS
jgi:hypothetical protein